MDTKFSTDQLAEPAIQIANDILRKCVHCGFCTATCPTYVLLGDELDSPRGRIYLIRDMLERNTAPSAGTVTHIDRCLSCLSCMTTCPSGVDYMHLVDHARAHVKATYRRPLAETLLRRLLAIVIPHPGLFRLSLIGAKLGGPFKDLLPGRLKGLVAMAPARIQKASSIDKPATHVAEGTKTKRVAILPGCAGPVLAPAINEATVRLLTRLGCEVVVAEKLGCCGALVHHMGEEDRAKSQAKANISAWWREIEGAGLDAIVINASGCGTQVKDYGHMLAGDPDWADKAARVSGLAKDVTEVLEEVGLGDRVQDFAKPVVAYHSACSMQHGQKLKTGPQALLKAAGFEVVTPKESHICCGSAGTYNIMQADLAEQLGQRKAANLAATGATVVAAGNIGCMVQIEQSGGSAVVHTVELLDWATGGPKPHAL